MAGGQKCTKNMNKVHGMVMLLALVVMASYVGQAEGLGPCWDECWAACHRDHYWTFCVPLCSEACIGQGNAPPKLANGEPAAALSTPPTSGEVSP